MTTHTPGPWATEPTKDYNATVRVMDVQEVTVALVYQQPYDTWKAEDIARLIAAAPDLLEVLIRVEEELAIPKLSPLYRTITEAIKNAT